jgi:hypothetical protein
MDNLFFYDARDGRAAVGRIDGDGAFVQTAAYDPGHVSAGWTHICRLESTLFFYNTATGEAAWGTLSDSGFAGTGQVSGGFSKGWTHVIGAPQIYVDVPRSFVFVNAITGAAALGLIETNVFTTLESYPAGAFGRGWTHVVPVPIRGVFFYDAASGAGLLAGVGRAMWTNRSYPPGSFSADWTHVIVRTNREYPHDHDVLVYRAGTGEAALVNDTVKSGKLEVLLGFTADSGGFSRGWTHAAGGTRLFFYNRLTGSAAVLGGVSYGPGEFRRGWTHVVGESSSGLMLGWGSMQGFSWPLSGSPGDEIGFRTSTAASTYTVSFVRFDNTESATADDVHNGRELIEETMQGPVGHAGLLQNTQLDPATGCGGWGTSFSLTVPERWQSGAYAAKCRDALGSVFYVPFVVKPAASQRRRLAALVNVMTWNAYNQWGGYSRYSDVVQGDADFSFLRPNFNLLNLSYTADHWDDRGSYHYDSQHLLRGELWVLNWLRAAGYDVDCYTDLDFHLGIDGLAGYDALILNTHPEYWSVAMYDSLKSYLDGGGRLLYLGGNGIYDSVDLSDDLTTMTVHGNQEKRTAEFRLIGRPEVELLGVAYTENVDARAPYAVAWPGHPLLEGIRHYGLRPIDSRALAGGDLIGQEGWCMRFGAATLADGAASGWEVDQAGGGTYPVEMIARGTNTRDRERGDMVLYRYGGDGFVFSVGSIAFGGSLVVDPILQAIVRNALDSCLAAGFARRILEFPFGALELGDW